MTAPDSVERVVAEMREELSYSVHVVEVSVSAFRAWADRLQALARGPQQAGGEDAPPCPVWLAGKDVSHAWAAGWNARNPHYAALQAEVARLTEDCNAIREAPVEAVIALREAGRDAARYRWLRDGRRDELCVREQGEDIIHPHLYAYYPLAGERLDAAIDAAIEQAAG